MVRADVFAHCGKALCLISFRVFSDPRDKLPNVLPKRMVMCKNAEPMLSVIMPVYNEAATVNEAIRRVLAAPFEKQLIVIDDGSTDGTPSALVEWADQETGRAVASRP